MTNSNGMLLSPMVCVGDMLLVKCCLAPSGIPVHVRSQTRRQTKPTRQQFSRSIPPTQTDKLSNLLVARITKSGQVELTAPSNCHIDRFSNMLICISNLGFLLWFTYGWSHVGNDDEQTVVNIQPVGLSISYCFIAHVISNIGSMSALSKVNT